MATDKDTTATMNGISVDDLKTITLRFADRVKTVNKDMDSELFANVCVAYSMRQFGSSAVREMLNDDDTFNETFSLMYRMYTETERMDPVKEMIGHMRDTAAGVDEPDDDWGTRDDDDDDIDNDDDKEDTEPVVSREVIDELKGSIREMEEAIKDIKRVLRELEEW